MPFPFLPTGLLLAIAVVATSLIAFGIALKALDWSIDVVRGTTLTQIVSGMRSWQSHSTSPQLPVASGPCGVEEYDEMTPTPAPLEAVVGNRATRSPD